MRAFALAAFVLVALPVVARSQEAPAIAVEAVAPTKDGLALRAVGTAPLPDGATVHASLVFDDTPGLYREVPVAGGRFEAHLGPVREKVLPGMYVVRVEFRARSQTAAVLGKLGPGFSIRAGERECYFGEKEKEPLERERVRKKMMGTMSLLRRVYLALAQQTSYSIDHAKILKQKNQGEIPADKVRQLEREWERFAQEFWEEMFATARFDWREFRRMVLVPYNPRAAEGIESLLVAFEKWYGACAADVYQELGRPVPERVASLRQFDRETMRARMHELVARIDADLGCASEPWQLTDIAAPEEGDVDGDRYTSKISKFAIEKPGEAWLFDRTLLSPAVRLRLRPAGEATKDSAVVAVEIRDFPEAEGSQDLVRLTEVMVGARWPGYKKVSAHPIQADDKTMPRGSRPGYDMVYTTEDGGKTFQIRDYVLFCRWYKRTYSVLCIAPKGRFKDFEKDFDRICRSFKVLDAPPAAPAKEGDR